MPPVPPEQVQARARLERILTDWGVPYRHEDRNYCSPNGCHVIHGWGTVIDRGRDHSPLSVWFSGIDHDLFIGGDGRRLLREYVEWLDLDSIEDVLDEMESVLAGLLAASQRRPRSRIAAALRTLIMRARSHRRLR